MAVHSRSSGHTPSFPPLTGHGLPGKGGNAGEKTAEKRGERDGSGEGRGKRNWRPWGQEPARGAAARTRPVRGGRVRRFCSLGTCHPLPPTQQLHCQGGNHSRVKRRGREGGRHGAARGQKTGNALQTRREAAGCVDGRDRVWDGALARAEWPRRCGQFPANVGAGKVPPPRSCLLRPRAGPGAPAILDGPSTPWASWRARLSGTPTPTPRAEPSAPVSVSHLGC